MGNDGWIKVHRRIMESDYWLSEPFTRAQAWIDLLLLANHKDGTVRKRGILFEVKRGQVGYSEETLADRWRWSRGKVRRFLGELKTRQQIERDPVQQNKKLSYLITIENYDLYQSDSTINETVDDTTSGTTDGQQTDNKRYRNKNVKKVKNEKNKDSCAEPSADAEPQRPMPTPFITLPLNDKTEYPIFGNMVDEWKTLFPKVDIEQELREIRAWNLSHTTQRKTKAGIMKHITGWLAKEQDKGGSNGNGKFQRREACEVD